MEAAAASTTALSTSTRRSVASSGGAMQRSSTLPRIAGAELAAKVRKRKQAEACVEQMANRLQHLRNQQERSVKEMQNARSRTRQVLNTKSRNEEARLARKKMMDKVAKRSPPPEMNNPDSWIPAAKTAGWEDAVVKPEEIKSKKDVVGIKVAHQAECHGENAAKRNAVCKAHARAAGRLADATRRRDRAQGARQHQRLEDEEHRERDAMLMLQRMELDEQRLAEQLEHSKSLQAASLSELSSTIFH